tara:strand:- start:51 stop:557 length:507 start_codon:yes stop_codon:yes gene_type:complete
MPDYSQGKIYKIECNVTDEVYYGSTTYKYLSSRLGIHKSKKTRCRSKQIIDRGNFNCKIIEEYPCNSRLELETRERWWIENNVCINKSIPCRTRDEWVENNKGKIKQKQSEWYEANKDKIMERVKQRYQDNKDKINENFTCECGGKYTRRHRLQHCRSKKHLEYISDK